MEKVTVFARLLEADSIQHNQVIQTALAHAFCLLIGSLEDINGAVAQRTIQYLDTIKTASIKVRFIKVKFDVRKLRCLDVEVIFSCRNSNMYWKFHIHEIVSEFSVYVTYMYIY